MLADHSHIESVAERPVARQHQNEPAVALRSVVALTPPHCYSNEEIASALDLPALPRVCRRIGIESRRTFVPLDIKDGRTVGALDNIELEMAERVAAQCIDVAAVARDSIAVLCYISCTAQRGGRIHFELTSHELVGRLKLRADIYRFEMDAGCDGFVRALHVVRSLFRVPPKMNVLIVVTSVPSIYFDRKHSKTLPSEAQFPNYVFGDGAAAAVVSFGPTGGGRIKATWAECNPDAKLAWTALARPGGTPPEIAYMIDYGEVDRSYVPAIVRAVTGLNGQYRSMGKREPDRVYFHQANGVLPIKAAQALGFPLDNVVIGARHDGNTAAACIPTLLARDLESGRIKTGSRVLLAAVGAGMASSAAMIEY